MKSLILKDLYNISHGIKSLLFILVIFTLAFSSYQNVGAIIFMCSMVGTMRISTTFAFDDVSGWNRYALVTPISKKDLARGKFAVLLLFCLVSTLAGLAVSCLLIVLKTPGIPGADILGELAVESLAAFGISFLLGCTSIPLTFRFGTEKGRLCLPLAYAAFSVILLTCHKLSVPLGIRISETLLVTLLACSPAAALLWGFAMYLVSCRILACHDI